MRVIGFIVVLVCICPNVFADDLAPPVELVNGLETGQIWAQFWGGGDTGVNGIIGRAPNGPRAVNIEPGTQFWAQTLGRQGQTGLGGRSIGLGGQAYMQVWIPTACTNINRPAPTPEDTMFASRCPNPDMAQLCGLPSLSDASRPAIQIAVWAVANDPPFGRVIGYVNKAVRESQGRLTFHGIMHEAADLLASAGLQPGDFRMFR